MRCNGCALMPHLVHHVDKKCIVHSKKKSNSKESIKNILKVNLSRESTLRQASSPYHQIGFGFVSGGICQTQEIYKY